MNLSYYFKISSYFVGGFLHAKQGEQEIFKKSFKLLRLGGKRICLVTENLQTADYIHF